MLLKRPQALDKSIFVEKAPLVPGASYQRQCASGKLVFHPGPP